MKYKNQSNAPVIIMGKDSKLTIAPGMIVELDDNIARRGFPYLVKLEERQLLIESPLPLEEKKEEKKEKPKKEKKKKTELVAEKENSESAGE